MHYMQSFNQQNCVDLAYHYMYIHFEHGESSCAKGGRLILIWFCLSGQRMSGTHRRWFSLSVSQVCKKRSHTKFKVHFQYYKVLQDFFFAFTDPWTSWIKSIIVVPKLFFVLYTVQVLLPLSFKYQKGGGGSNCWGHAFYFGPTKPKLHFYMYPSF